MLISLKCHIANQKRIWNCPEGNTRELALANPDLLLAIANAPGERQDLSFNQVFEYLQLEVGCGLWGHTE